MNAVVPAAPIIIPGDVMNSTFKEWIKIATGNVSILFFALRLNCSIRVLLLTNQTIIPLSFVDRKSTRTTFVLIDYFHGMSHCEPTPTTQSTSNGPPVHSTGA